MAMAAQSDIVAQRDRLLIATAAAWMRGAYALKASREYRRSVAQLERLRKSVKAREKSGFSSAADVNAVDARIASLRRELANLDEIATKAQVEVDMLTAGRVKLTEELPSDAAIGAYGDTDLVRMAVERNPLLQSAVHASNAATHDSRAARLDYMPKLRMNGEYNSRGRYGDVSPRDDMTIGVRLTVPIFRPSQIATISEKKELADAAYWQARDVEKSVIMQLRMLLRERDAAAQKRRQAAQEAAELERLVGSLEARYREGFASIDELLNQQIALARVRAQAVEVRTQQLYTEFQILVFAGLADQQAG